jgi:hypothetical protein
MLETGIYSVRVGWRMAVLLHCRTPYERPRTTLFRGAEVAARHDNGAPSAEVPSALRGCGCAGGAARAVRKRREDDDECDRGRQDRR